MLMLRKLLIKHEGIRYKAYRDTVGKLTIGVGRNLDDVGLSNIEAMLLLTNDIDRVCKEAIGAFPWFNSLNPARQDVFLEMLFNLGLTKFQGFVRMIDAARFGQYDRAADEMINSKWATQVGIRAAELAYMMRYGLYDSREM
jgi:lysozyme